MCYELLKKNSNIQINWKKFIIPVFVCLWRALLVAFGSRCFKDILLLF